MPTHLCSPNGHNGHQHTTSLPDCLHNPVSEEPLTSLTRPMQLSAIRAFNNHCKQQHTASEVSMRVATRFRAGSGPDGPHTA